MQTALGIIVLALIGLWLFVRRRERKSEPAAPRTAGRARAETSKKSTPYHAVSISYEGKACRAAAAMTGKRFLSGSAPRLPLPECDVPECKCRFVHHADRRSGTDRRSPFSGGLGLTGRSGNYEKERRANPERRSGDDGDTS